MDLSASYTFPASAATVWNLLINPDVVASCLPGCDRLEPLGDDRYRAELTLAVAAVSGQYTGTVAILDKRPPLSYRLVVEGAGKAGFAKGEATVELIEESETTTVKVTGQTGVEMEALTAASVACLTIYDMVKAVEKGMRIEGIRLLEKFGGKSGHYRAEGQESKDQPKDHSSKG